jgi:hypothetical protein
MYLSMLGYEMFKVIQNNLKSRVDLICVVNLVGLDLLQRQGRHG